jgi:hypothetical protein
MEMAGGLRGAVYPVSRAIALESRPYVVLWSTQWIEVLLD